MKIRSSFVSNSSSSSYIVEFQSREQMITVGKGADLTVQDFFDAFYPSHFCDNELREVTDDEDEKKQLLESLDSYIEYVTDEEKPELLALKKDIEKSEKLFARFDVSYHDNVLHFLLQLLCDNGAMKIRHETEA